MYLYGIFKDAKARQHNIYKSKVMIDHGNFIVPAVNLRRTK